MTFRFDGAEVRKLIEHSRNAPEQATFYGDTFDNPMLLLVKDQGVYLMSNGRPRQLVEEGSQRSVVAYAEGHNPEIDDFDDWYVGGDDFADPLPVEMIESALRGSTKLEVKLTTKTMKVRGVG